MRLRNGPVHSPGWIADRQERSALLEPGLSPVVTKLVEVVLVGCWWLALYPLCHAADGDVTWNGQLALAPLPMLWWFVLAGRNLPAWWLRRDRLPRILAARFWPVLAAATAPAYPAILSRSYHLDSVPVVAIYATGLLFLLTLTPLALRLRSEPAAPGERPASMLGQRMLAVGGACCAFSLLHIEALGTGRGPWTEWFLELLRDALRWAGLIGLSLFLVARAERFPRWSFGLYHWYRRLGSGRVLLFCCLLSTLLSGLFAYFVLDRMPHIQDEIAMIFQAKNFAQGRLYAPAPPIPEFFDMEYVVIDGNRWYGKYQFGPSLWYVPGVWLNCVWLVSPVFSALAMVVLFLLVREVLGRHWAKGAVLLAVVSPWWVMTYGSMMAHAGCLLVLSAFVLFFVRAARRPQRWAYALLSGAMLGLAINFRPYTAILIGVAMIIVALPAGWWRRLKVKNTIAFLLPLAGFVALMLAYNHALTGDALVTPFQKWSPYDRLGFGVDKGLYGEIGLGHTPADALENLQWRLQRLGRSLLGWPAATLLLVVLPLMSPSRRGRNALILLGPLSLAIGYCFYHYGWPLYGVRYWAESLPAYLMLTLLGLVVVRRWVRSGMRLSGTPHAAARARAFGVCVLTFLVLSNLIGYAPDLVRRYESEMWPTNCAARQAVERAALHNALVFMDASHYRSSLIILDSYGSGFQLMSPSLDDQVLFVRDLGRERNRALMALYPDRQPYRLRQQSAFYAELGPYELVETPPAPNGSE